MDTVTIEQYDGPAVELLGATHRITISPDDHSEWPDEPLLREGLLFRYEDGPYLKILIALVERRKYEGHTPGLTHQDHHVYLAQEEEF